MTVIIIILSIFMSFLTFYRKKSWSAVRMSSYMGLMIVFSDFFTRYLKITMDPMIVTAAFGATFVGMCSREKFGSGALLMASFLYGILFILFFPYLNGIGGALGFLAFLSVALSWLVIQGFSLILKTRHLR